MSSRTRQPQADVDSLRAELLTTIREELRAEQDTVRETFREETQALFNTLGNREQGDQARAASAQQHINDRVDVLQEQLQLERIEQGRRFEFLQANAREAAAPLIFPHHNGMRREAQICTKKT